MTFTYEANEYEFEGEFFTVEIDCECTVTPYDPGRTYGPPELCYPPEGGDVEDLEVHDVTATDSEGIIVAGNTLDLIKAQIMADLENHGPLCEEIEEYAADLASDPDHDDD